MYSPPRQPRQSHLKAMLEGEELRPVTEVPLADNLAPVAHCGQELRQEDLAVLDTSHYLLGSVGVPPGESVLVKPGTEGKTTSEERGSGGGADGSAGVELGEQEAFLGHPVWGSQHRSLSLTLGNNYKLLDSHHDHPTPGCDPLPVNVGSLLGRVPHHSQVAPAQVVQVDDDEVRLLL